MTSKERRALRRAVQRARAAPTENAPSSPAGRIASGPASPAGWWCDESPGRLSYRVQHPVVQRWWEPLAAPFVVAFALLDFLFDGASRFVMAVCGLLIACAVGWGLLVLLDVMPFGGPAGGFFTIVLVTLGGGLLLAPLMGLHHEVTAFEFDLAHGSVRCTRVAPWLPTRRHWLALADVLSVDVCIDRMSEREGHLTVRVRLPGGQEPVLDFARRMPLEPLLRHAGQLRAVLGERVALEPVPPPDD